MRRTTDTRASMSRQKVQVFAIGLRKAGTPEEKRRFYVRWRIDGRDKMRALKTKGEAERFCSRLQHAIDSRSAIRSEHGDARRMGQERRDVVDVEPGVAPAQVATVGW